MSALCREPTFVFVLNDRLTTGTKKTGKKKTGKKARSSVSSIGKQLYSSESLVDRLAITSCLQLSSIVADMSAVSVRLDNNVCTTLLANNREEENRDDRPSHFFSFSYYFAAYDLLQDKYLNYRPNSQIFARRGRKAPLQYCRMICDSHFHIHYWSGCGFAGCWRYRVVEIVNTEYSLQLKHSYHCNFST